MCLVTAPLPFAVWWPGCHTDAHIVFAADRTEAARVFVERHLTVWDARGYARNLSGTYTLKVAMLLGGDLRSWPDVEVAWEAHIPAGFTRPAVLLVGP